MSLDYALTVSSLALPASMVNFPPSGAHVVNAGVDCGVRRLLADLLGRIGVDG
ncbi:hypothetical protein [Cerasicoccus maritimus]|uniref:hypothetical protein n=1 Tax=Cerasicoccus maritimus TaxID=490089 RepID=UPI002852A6E6|nr:hypothetical protein [Cerasicoccus maritimus]